MDKAPPVTAGRSPEWPATFPDIMLYSGHAGDGAECLTAFDRRTVVLSRPVAGLACKIRLNVGSYDAVAVVARDQRNVVCLLHRDPGLSVDLTETDSLEAAEEYRDNLADFLGLPPLMMAGAVVPAGKSAVPSRRNRSVRARRPRFLARRKPGGEITLRKLDCREIIARN